LEIKDGNDGLDLQDIEDVEAASDLGKDASDDIHNEIDDEIENTAEDGADEASNLIEEGADLDLDGDADDGVDGGTSTEDEVEDAGQEPGNGNSVKNTTDESAEDPIQWEANELLDIFNDNLKDILELVDEGFDDLERGVVGCEATEFVGDRGDQLDGGGEDNLQRDALGVVLVAGGDRIDTSDHRSRIGEGSEGQGGEDREAEGTHC